eukprot:scaffold200407_cov49-Attheya_sp.AAC.5
MVRTSGLTTTLFLGKSGREVNRLARYRERETRETRLFESSSTNSAEQEAKELLEKVRKMREEIALLEGRSVEDVEEEAQMKAKQNRERIEKEVADREVSRARTKEERQSVLLTDGSFLEVPDTADDQVRQAAAAVEQVRAIVEPNDETDAKAGYRPKVKAQDIWDFDGSALVTAEAPSGAANDVQALVFPNTDDKYSKDIAKLDEGMKERLFLLVNPFWRNLESWGFNILAPNAKKLAQSAIFDKGFNETYCLLQRSVQGEDCVALKAYPYDWQLYVYLENPYWPYTDEVIHLGSTRDEPTTVNFTTFLKERDEFKMSKNMRQMQRMMGKDPNNN